MTGNPPPQEAGDPGASLQAEYDKRKRVREERIRAAHPKLGGLILGLSDDPQSTRAFAAGAAGERAAAAALEKRCGDSVLFLHNRRLHSSSRGDIDHVAVTGNGVWVIDTKHYKGKKVEVRRSGGLFSERREQLFIGGRDNTKLLVSVAKQVKAVQAALATCTPREIEVKSVLCFIDANLPLLSSLAIAGTTITGPKGTAKLLMAPGPLDANARSVLHRALAAALPPA